MWLHESQIDVPVRERLGLSSKSFHTDLDLASVPALSRFCWSVLALNLSNTLSPPPRRLRHRGLFSRFVHFLSSSTAHLGQNPRLCEQLELPQFVQFNTPSSATRLELSARSEVVSRLSLASLICESAKVLGLHFSVHSSTAWSDLGSLLSWTAPPAI